MSQLLCISSKSTAEDGRQVGDIVGVFSDSHTFSSHEYDIFSVVKVADKREDIEAIAPIVERVCKDDKDAWVKEEVYRETELAKEGVEPETKEVWYDAKGDAKEVVNSPRFTLRWDGAKVVDNYSTDEANKTTLIAAETTR